MHGVFFGAQQVRPGVVGYVCDDTYYERPGTLVPLHCDEPDRIIDGTVVEDHFDVALAKATSEAYHAAIAAAPREVCTCGAHKIVARAWPRPPHRDFPPWVVRCPTAHGLRRAQEEGESGPLYRRRPFRVDDPDIELEVQS